MNNEELKKAIDRALGHIKNTKQSKEIGEILDIETSIRQYAFDLHLTFDKFSHFYVSDVTKFSKFVFGVFETRENIKGMFGDNDVLMGTNEDKTVLKFCFRR